MFLSIIIPVYNTERFLEECIRSCLMQNIPATEYEIICVNDGSPDNSAVILSRFEKEYPNVKVITQANGGLSRARNVGLDAAQGEYVWFVDSDDFIQENCLNRLLCIGRENKPDRICFGRYECEMKLSEEEYHKAQSGQLVPTSFLGYGVCENLYRRAFLLRGVRFREEIRKYGEDGLFMYELNYHKPSSVTVNEVFYFYRRNNGSIMRTRTEASMRERANSSFFISKVLIEYLLKNQKSLQEKNADFEEKCSVLMPDVRGITINAASLPDALRKEIIVQLRSNHLFPLFLYRKPKDWFPQKIHMNHSYMGVKGRILDVLNFYSTTRLGFEMLVFLNKIRRKVS